MKEKIISAIYENRYTYVLLSDGRILRSKEMGNTHCAKTYAEMFKTLDITPQQLIDWAGWEETDE